MKSLLTLDVRRSCVRDPACTPHGQQEMCPCRLIDRYIHRIRSIGDRRYPDIIPMFDMVRRRQKEVIWSIVTPPLDSSISALRRAEIEGARSARRQGHQGWILAYAVMLRPK